MKKFLLLAVAALTAVSMMAIGTGDGKTHDNAIEFSWENGHEQGAQPSGINYRWYRVPLAPLYNEEKPTLSLYLISQSLMDTIEVTLDAELAGQKEHREFTILPGKHKAWSVDATALVRMHQTEAFIKLTAKSKVKLEKGKAIKLSAKVYDAVDLDEACKSADAFDWTNGVTVKKGELKWFKVDLKKAKAATDKDVKITIKNTGSAKLNLRAGQSMDCPSSGITKRSFVLEAGATVEDVIPQSMIKGVAADELYVTFDNNQPISVKAELVAKPAEPLYKGTPDSLPVVTDQTIAKGEHFFRISVKQMNDSAKYEPEFTFRNTGAAPVKIIRKMAFENPVWGWQTSEIEIAAGDEVIEVIKKNVVEGINVEETPYVYILINTDADFQLLGRYKHVREGKACKSNIDFNWEKGHVQDAKTTQWYAIDVKPAKDAHKDIRVKVENLGYDKAKVSAALAFSCPYIDLQEGTRTIAVGKSIETVVSYSAYAMMTDTIWAGVTTDQDIRITTEEVEPETKTPTCSVDDLETFSWEEGGKVLKGEPKWFQIDMTAVRGLEQFPTLYVRNLSTENAVTIKGEMSLDCPDIYANQERELKIKANGTYSKQLSRNMFQNITADLVYLRVEATEDVSFELRFTEEAEGTTCNSAIDFNWTSGNDQAANANLWYKVDLKSAIEKKQDVILHILNKEKKECTGAAYIAYDCSDEQLQKVSFTLAATAPDNEKSKTVPYSAFANLEGGVIYVRLVGNTALRIWAELKDAEKLADPIACETIAAGTTVEENTEYTQNGGKAWYTLSKSLKDSLATGELTAELHVWNESGADLDIIGEVAFECPVEYEMVSKKLSVNKKEYVKAIAANTALQLAGKENVFFRLKADGKFRFELRIVSAYSGNTRESAVRLQFNKEYVQEANTTMWYRINTADLKNVDNIDGLRVYGEASTSADSAHVEAAVFEDVSDQDMIEFFTGRQAKYTIKKEQARKHNVPGYAVKALADKVVYVRLTSDKELRVSTKTSVYPKLASVDTEAIKESAILLVPNVDYELPAGGQWFKVCLPQLLDNFELTKDASFDIANPNSDSVKITGKAAWEEGLIYDVPVRSRKIGKHHFTKTFYEAIDAALARRNISFSIDGTDPAFLDSMAHEYLTKEHLAAYVFVKHDGAKPLTGRINAKPKTGKDAKAPVVFDWEHGNVNPGKANAEKNISPLTNYAAETTTFLVEVDEEKVPEGKDIELHITNWGKVAGKVTAKVSVEDKEETREYTLEPGEENIKRISRQLFIGYSNALIELTSDEATFVKVDTVPELICDPTEVDSTIYWCRGIPFEYKEEVIGTIETADGTLTFDDEWSFKREDEQGIVECDSIVHFTVRALKDPTLPTIEEIIAAEKKVYTAEATAWLVEQLAAQVDEPQTVAKLREDDPIVWEKAVDNENVEWIALAEAELTDKDALVIRYRAITECGYDLTSEVFKNTVRDTLEDVTECFSYYWELKDTTYLKSTDGYDTDTATLDNGCTKITYLKVTIKSPAVTDLKAVGKFGKEDGSNTLMVVISRPSITDKMGGIETPLFYEKGGDLEIKWFKEGVEEPVGEGYSFNNPDGSVLEGTFYAIVLVADGSDCGRLGRTNNVVCKASEKKAMPALVPNMVMPGENINVINLDPTTETLIRVFTSEGLLHNTYKVRGQETFNLKAAADHGFYLVELYNEELNTTLRYIVK